MTFTLQVADWIIFPEGGCVFTFIFRFPWSSWTSFQGWGPRKSLNLRILKWASFFCCRSQHFSQELWKCWILPHKLTGTLTYKAGSRHTGEAMCGKVQQGKFTSWVDGVQVETRTDFFFCQPEPVLALSPKSARCLFSGTRNCPLVSRVYITSRQPGAQQRTPNHVWFLYENVFSFVVWKRPQDNVGVWTSFRFTHAWHLETWPPQIVNI